MTDIKAIWQNQPMEDNEMINLSEIRARAESFKVGVRWRNLSLYAYSIANIAIRITARACTTVSFRSVTSSRERLNSSAMITVKIIPKTA